MHYANLKSDTIYWKEFMEQWKHHIISVATKNRVMSSIMQLLHDLRHLVQYKKIKIARYEVVGAKANEKKMASPSAVRRLLIGKLK